MSDHTFREWPPVDPSRKSREKGSWSVEDRQMLLITFVGGLAANVGAVLIVGLALALLHMLQSGFDHPVFIALLVTLFVGCTAMPFWVLHSPKGSLWLSRLPRYGARTVLALPLACAAMLVLSLVGLAAGIK
jgi:hypothetical protein